MRQGYAPAQKILHWLVAGLVIGALGFGMTIGFYGYEGLVKAFGQSGTNVIYKYHKTAGVLILLLMTLRLAARLRWGKPDHDPPLKDWERIASTAVHHALYVCLFLMPILGWAATAAGGYPVEFFEWRLPGLLGKDEALSKTLYGAHGLVGLVTLLLAAVHICGALKHWLLDRDGVMRRML